MKKFYNLAASSLYLSKMIAKLEQTLRTSPQNMDQHKHPYTTEAATNNEQKQQNYRLKMETCRGHRGMGLKHIVLA